MSRQTRGGKNRCGVRVGGCVVVGAAERTTISNNSSYKKAKKYLKCTQETTKNEDCISNISK